MTQREGDWREGEMIAQIERKGEFVAFDPEDILRDD